MDHGILNIPLAKRGDIDAQIDSYKAEKAAERTGGEAYQSVQSMRFMVRFPREVTA